MANKDGWAKNWEVVRQEICSTWNNAGDAAKSAWGEFREAQGVAERAHKAVNILTEIYRGTGITIPRTLTYLTIIVTTLVILWIVL